MVVEPIPCVRPLVCTRLQLDLPTTVRMLSAPLRQCTVSKRYLPNGTRTLSCTGASHLVFMSRFSRQTRGATLTHSAKCPLGGGPHARWTRTSEIQTEKSARRRVCNLLEGGRRDSQVTRLAIPFSTFYSSAHLSPVSLPHYSAKIVFSKHLCAHISYLLRLRVLQELNVLIDALKLIRGRLEFDADADATILRRLTRSEFKTFCETGMIPYSDAVAVLVVPPVNRDPRTKVRPRPSHEPDIPSGAPPNVVHRKPLPPLSSLHDVSAPEGASDQGADEIPLSTFLPNARVPQYNGFAMFPSPPHRAAFHKSLMELLDIERQFRGTRKVTARTDEFKRAKGDAKGSHAFLLMSNEQTVKRADTAALAIALWRLRMWEGDAFAGKVKGWDIGRERGIEQSDL